MKSKEPKKEQFQYFKPRKVNGGVGAKMAQSRATPIRLKKGSNQLNSDYSQKACLIANSYSKPNVAGTTEKAKKQVGNMTHDKRMSLLVGDPSYSDRANKY